MYAPFPALTYYVEGLVSDRGLVVFVAGLQGQIFPVDGEALVTGLNGIESMI